MARSPNIEAGYYKYADTINQPGNPFFVTLASTVINARLDAFHGESKPNTWALVGLYNLILLSRHQPTIELSSLHTGRYEVNTLLPEHRQPLAQEQISDIDPDYLRQFITRLVQARLPGKNKFGVSQREWIKERYHLDAPLAVVIEVTQACNLHGASACQHCFKDASGKVQTGKLDLKTLLSLARQSQFLGVDSIIFSGGEPTLKLNEINQVANQVPGILFLTFTNGLIFAKKPEVIQHLSPGLLPILSLTPAFDPESHRVELANERITAAAYNLHTAGRPFIASLVLNQTMINNPQAIEDINKRLSTWRPFGLLLLPYMPIGNDPDRNLAIIGNRPQHMLEIGQQLRAPFVMSEHSLLHHTGNNCPAGSQIGVVRPLEEKVGICPYDNFGIDFNPNDPTGFIKAWQTINQQASLLRPDRSSCHLYHHL